MIIIRESIIINAPVSEVYNFFNNLKENYMTMHPDHIECACPQGKIENDMVIKVKEVIANEVHTFKLHLIKVAPKIIIYELPLSKGAIILEETDKRTRLTEEIHIGIKTPLIGRVIDKTFKILYPGFSESLKKHFINELINIKKTIEGDVVSMSTY